MLLRPPLISIIKMTITSNLHPDTSRLASPPLLPGAMLSNPDLARLYMSASCPDLKAESVFSSDDETEASQQGEADKFDPLESHDEDRVPSMDLQAMVPEMGPPLREKSAAEPVVEAQAPALQPSMSSLSTSSSASSSTMDASARRKLQWEFKGLTLWLELEEFDDDLTRAVEDFSSRHSSPFIPKPHTTAIYGMDHISADEARGRLRRVGEEVGTWPSFARPTGVTSDIAVCGRPGQVCSIAWSELTLASGPGHEEALDRLYRLFYGEDFRRDSPWKPHNSIAYDNPETNALSLLDTVVYASENPSLLGRERRVEAISLWSTEGKMEDWFCIDRFRFW